jgi:predicted phage tail protein
MGAPGDKAAIIRSVPPDCAVAAAGWVAGAGLVVTGFEVAGTGAAEVVAGVVVAGAAAEVVAAGWPVVWEGVAALLQPLTNRIHARKLANGIRNFFNLFLLTIFRITPQDEANR